MPWQNLFQQLGPLLPKAQRGGLGYSVAQIPMVLRSRGHEIESAADSELDQTLANLATIQSKPVRGPSLLPSKESGVVLAVAELVNHLAGGRSSLLPSYMAGRSHVVEAQREIEEHELQAKLNEAAIQMQRAKLGQAAAMRKSNQLFALASNVDEAATQHRNTLNQRRHQTALQETSLQASRLASRRDFLQRSLQGSSAGRELYARYADAIDAGEIPEEVKAFLGRESTAKAKTVMESESSDYVANINLGYIGGLTGHLPSPYQSKARLAYRAIVDGALQELPPEQLTSQANALIETLEVGLDTLRAEFRKGRKDPDAPAKIHALESELYRLHRWVDSLNRGFRPVTPNAPKGLQGPITGAGGQ